MFLISELQMFAYFSVFRIPKQCLENIVIPCTFGMLLDNVDDL